MTSEPASSKPTDTREQDSVCPKCGGELVPTHWLASVGEYPAKEVVKVAGVRCKSCSYVRFEYDPHGSIKP